MDRKFLLMLAAICGAVVVVTVLLIPIAGRGGASVNFVEAGALGVWLILFGVFAAVFAALLFTNKTAVLGLGDAQANTWAMLMFGLGAFFGLAGIIGGTEGMKLGFWLYWIACLVGTFCLVLTANPALAQKIADAAGGADDKPSEAAYEEKPAE